MVIHPVDDAFTCIYAQTKGAGSKNRKKEMERLFLKGFSETITMQKETIPHRGNNTVN